MGVPKFFRYISERYPCLSELVKEHQIPQFDNLYLDMNGIIHTCSHPDDDDPHFRITEEKIIQDIFHYIEVLFRMIKPRKLFFMAVDGVAPRAKMNQQRARRFRSAKDAEKLEEKAKKKGEVLPSEARFDSNCITPGTVFMAKLHEQLKYFVVNKISTDKLWTQCRIILSGHETPGEGEHKIMDYIRYMRAQPNYDPNTRHCLYGLDADLIMLGLCTHEPHFSLLREEVKFGRKSTKRKSTPEDITFYLLHLSLMREYLELEFKDLELDERMKFRLDIEKIIDDWVLMGFLVGNDFIPNLPNLHIANGALPVLYQTYMKVIPTFDGYINEGGTLNLVRFEKFMEALAAIDLDSFQEQYVDMKYFEMKTGRKPNATQRKSYKLEPWKPENGECEDFIQFEPLEPPKNSEIAALIQATNDELFGDSNENENELTESEDDNCDIEAEFKQHKRDYYANKLDYKIVTPEVLQSQAEGYVRAIQWNLNYYYNGVCSWSWFYPHHYAPYISDIKGFSDLKFEFDLGKPFYPYEQLLGVLPALSKSLLPEAYHHLMTDENSLIKSYYPDEFETDLNGKKADWEAVVLIPFIDEKILLKAMSECADRLSPEEVKRNQHGPMLIYEYTTIVQRNYEAPEYFPTVQPNYAKCHELTIEEIRVPREKLVKGAYPGVKQDIYFPGFPTTKHLKYDHHLEKAHIKVHEHPSRNESMLLTLKQQGPSPALDVLAREILGKVVYAAWPHLSEALAIAVSNKQFRYNSTGIPGQYNVMEARGNVEHNWNLEKNSIMSYYHNRFGIEVGETDILVHVKILIGRKYAFTKQGRVTLERQWAPISTAYPYQSIVRDISVHDEHYSMFRDVEHVFPAGSTCFMLGHPYYGCTGEVKDSKETIKIGRIKVCMKCPEEPDFESIQDYAKNIKIKYMSAHEAAAKLAISRQLFTRVTGSILVSLTSKLSITEDTNKVNIGLNLKFNKKNEEIPGYTKKEVGTLWLYSEKVCELVKQYHEFCPALFEYLNDSNENFYYADDIFPDSNGKEKIVELSNWIKAQPFYNIDKRPCGTKMLEPEVVRKIEELVDEYKIKVNEKQDEVTLKVKPHILYKPDLFIGHIVPDPNSRYQLYDRVVNVRESYTVPLGLKGTVIAIHRSDTENQDTGYDVVFDEEFAGGYSLNCSPNRGYRLPRSALINISYGQREYERKTGKPGELTNQMRSSMKHNLGKHPETQPQQSAFVPCPPGGNPKITYHPQNNSYMYQNSYNNLYVPPHARGQPSQGRTQLPLSAMVQPRDTIPPFTNNQRQKVIAGPINESQYNNGRQIILKERRTDNQPQQQLQPQQQQPPQVDLDYLKKVLKITPNKLTETDETSNENQKQPTVEDIFSHANSKPLGPTQPKQEIVTSNSVRLLSYYQSNGLGCPHYSYFDLPNKTIQAQLINPLNGQVVCGQPSIDKVEACENVAGEVLKTVENIPLTQPLPPFIPQPPINWRQPQNKAPVKDKARTNVNTTASSKQNASLSATASPFIPLQAVRSYKHKNSHMNKKDAMKSGSSNTTNNINNLSEQNRSKNVIASTTDKPLRKRTMRIAANFPTQFEK